MAAREGHYYYNSGGGTIGDNQVSGVRIEFKGTTKDGFNIHHFTYQRDGNHISYDTVKINGEYHYIVGSGHTTYHGQGKPTKWDDGNRVTWQEALQKNARDLIK